MKVHFICSEEGDWIAMYVDGKKVEEGHSISEQDVIRALGIKPTTEYAIIDPYQPSDKYFPEEIKDSV